MKYLNSVNAIAAVLWGFHFIKFLIGNYYPDRVMIGLSMFLATVYFILTFRINIKKQKGETNE